MTQNDAKFDWTPERERAAQLAANGGMTDEEIAGTLGVSRATVTRWKRAPEFQSRVKSLSDQINQKLQKLAIRDKERRIRSLENQIKRLEFVMKERGEDMKDVPGGKAGVLVRQIKSIGAGNNAREVKEYAVDVGMLKEYREALKYLAIHMGEWAERREHTGPGGAPLNPPSLTVLIDGKAPQAPPETGPGVPKSGD